MKLKYNFAIFFLLVADAFAFETIFVKDPKTGQTMEVVKDQVLVKFRPGTKSSRRSAVHFSASAFPVAAVPSIGVEAVHISTATSILETIEKYQKNGDVEFAEPNGIYYASLVPNDTWYSQQWGPQKIQAPEAWNITTGSASVIVAVVDTGVDYAHPDFGGRMSSTLPVIGGYDFINNDSDPMDDNAHGTHVAGTIGAITNNGRGVAGLSWNARILAVKVLGASGSGSWLTISQGIDYAVRNGAHVINLSLGGSFPAETVAAAVNQALSAGVSLIIASGNSGNTTAVGYPAAFRGVVAVGASDIHDSLTSFSQTGPEIAIVAPGRDIVSSVLSGGYSSFNGTSMATPHVAGVAALILSVRPGLSPSAVRTFLTASADDLETPGFDNRTGYGRLNAFRAVQMAQRGFSPEALAKSVPMPNPFQTYLAPTVTLSVPESLGKSSVRVRIYNLTGTLVRTLSDTNIWDGKNDDGQGVASGLYYYTLETDKGGSEGRLTLIR